MSNNIDHFFGDGGVMSKKFPGYIKRDQQIVLANAIEDTMNTKGFLLGDAGTGTGKSASYLIPSFERAIKGDTVIISTHTISLQSQLIDKDIKLVKELYGQEAQDVEVVQLKGRSNYACDVAISNSLSDLVLSHDTLSKKVRGWYQGSATGDKAELTFKVNNWEEYTSSSDSCSSRKCPSYYNCAYYRNRARARHAKIIIVNHALFFTDLVMRIDAGCVPETFSEGEFKREFLLPDYQHVVFDEAHHLEEVATEAFGVSMSSRKIPGLVKKIQKLGIVAQDSLNILEQSNEELFNPLLENKFDFTLQNSESLSGCVEQLNHAISGVYYPLYRRWEMLHDRDHDDPEAAKIKPLVNSLERSKADIHDILQCDTSIYVRWGHVEHGKWPKVEINKTPISVAPQLRSEMWKPFKDKVSVTMVSATLSADGKTFGYVKNHLGLEQAREVIVDSPFDYKNNCMLYVPKNLQEPEKVYSTEYAQKLALEMMELVSLTGGGALLLFTSRSAMDKVHTIFAEETVYYLLKQGDMGISQLIKEFKEHGDAVLFGVSSLWTGIDIQGDALRLLVVDKIPFAVPTGPVQEAKLEHIKKRGGNPFSEYSIPQAMITLRQGTGRLIRTVTDRGIVAIMDSRLHSRKSYGPRIVRALPDSKKATEFSKVEEWWKENL